MTDDEFAKIVPEPQKRLIDHDKSLPILITLVPKNPDEIMSSSNLMQVEVKVGDKYPYTFTSSEDKRLVFLEHDGTVSLLHMVFEDCVHHFTSPLMDLPKNRIYIGRDGMKKETWNEFYRKREMDIENIDTYLILKHKPEYDPPILQSKIMVSNTHEIPDDVYKEMEEYIEANQLCINMEQTGTEGVVKIFTNDAMFECGRIVQQYIDKKKMELYRGIALYMRRNVAECVDDLNEVLKVVNESMERNKDDNGKEESCNQ